jgi:hypothetical protein
MMMKPLLAVLASAALPFAAFSQPQASDGWTVNAGEDGCIAYASLPQGTVVSLLAGTGQENLVFLIQNKSWSSLRDGSAHKLAVQLDGRSPFQFDAVARTDLDSDGPGLLFSVPPGEQNGAKFLAEFAAASGMNLGAEGRSLAQLRLTGGSSAMAALAKCMASMWGGGGASGNVGAASFSSDGKAIPL